MNEARINLRVLVYILEHLKMIIGYVAMGRAHKFTILNLKVSFNSTYLYRYDELKDFIRVMRNSQKIKDVAKVLTGMRT